MKRFLLLALLLATPTAYTAELQAPLGLEWGMTQGQAKSKGIVLSDCQPIEGVTFCTTKNPPIPVSIAQFYSLVFFPKHGLHRVTIIGNDIKSDLYGTEGKELYASLKARLTKKYGAPAGNDEWIGRKLFNQADEFYECLDYDGCGSWETDWQLADGGTLILQLRSLERGKGYIGINYKSAKFSEIATSRYQDQADQDDSGL